MSQELEWSRDFLAKVLKGDLENIWMEFPFEKMDLKATMHWSDQEKMVFWINLYNASAQILLVKGNEGINKQIFGEPCIPFLNRKLSLDEIEHGILRKGKWKKGLGYLPAYRPLKAYFVKELDYRVHFLLNCAAESCPIIRLLDIDNFEKELYLAEQEFILQTTKIQGKRAQISSLFLFYWADFGGRRGVVELLERHTQTKPSDLRFQNFSWKPRFGKTKY